MLQFGTGVFLRGLIDYFIDKANKQSIFNGRVVVVKSTEKGDTAAFAQQDNLYTLVIKSVDDGNVVDENSLISAISRVLSAKDEWTEILKCADNPELQIIISNTTEVGITLQKDDRITTAPPASFPGKLLAFLHRRYQTFKGSAESGMVIIPTELIPDNATLLKNILNELAVENRLEKQFIDWLNMSNDFCNSLVDRIVPGKFSPAEHKMEEEKIGYEDNLMIMSESYALWAIETASERTKQILSFSEANSGIHIVSDISKFRELKLRLLNASHNLSAPLAFITGFDTVKEAMANPEFDKCMRRLILEEIAAAITSNNISRQEAEEFGSKVLDRYRNPFIEFKWLSICVQQTSKLRIRAVPVILQSFQKTGSVPDGISLGFTAYLLFMKSEKNETGEYIGRINNKDYTIIDDFAPNLYQKWKEFSGRDLVNQVLKDEALWQTNLSLLGDFSKKVYFLMENLREAPALKGEENTFLKLISVSA